MADRDTYLTVSPQAVGKGYYSEKRSKFLAFCCHVETIAEADEVVKNYRREFHDARHVCYAYRLGPEGEIYRANDDGEPSGTAGKPILGQLVSHELSDVIIVVVRYYGGINLGTGGLIVAYRTAASEALDDVSIVTKTVEGQVTFDFTYPMMNCVMRVVKEMQARIIDRRFDTDCSITLAVPASRTEELRRRLNELSFS